MPRKNQSSNEAEPALPRTRGCDTGVIIQGEKTIEGPETSLREEDLAQFVGTTAYYPTMFKMLYTDGVRFLADRAQAYWLIDAIASHWITNEKIRKMNLTFWTLTVDEDMTAVLECFEDIPGALMVRQKIPWTDFPLDKIDLWVNNGVLHLPSEH